MKITIEHEGIVVIIEDQNAVVMDEALALIQQALYGVGYRFSGELTFLEKDLDKDLEV